MFPILSNNRLPSPPSPDLYAFLAAYTPEVQAIALRLRQLILEIVPESIEQVDRSGKLNGYGFKPTYKDTICVITPLKAAVNLGFPRGVDLPDPARSLVGTGKRARHMKITNLQEVDNPLLRALLQASVEITQSKG